MAGGGGGTAVGGGSRKGRTVVVGGPADGPWDGWGKKLSEVEETPEVEQGMVLFILHRMTGKNRLARFIFPFPVDLHLATSIFLCVYALIAYK